MSITSIEWTDRTWNPVRGCSMAKGSETGGCLNCYAARMAARNLPELKSPTTGEPFARILSSGPRWTGKVELIESALALPLKWRKPQKIFVNSMSDLFHEALTDEQIDRVFAVIALCPQHTFQILTKRPERMLTYLQHNRMGRDYRERVYNRSYGMSAVYGGIAPGKFPLPNVWLGVSCEDQTTADKRLPLLLQTPAAVRFVSYEPALGPVDFTQIEFRKSTWYDSLEDHDGWGLLGAAHKKLDWIIVGGESGPGARPFDIQWARNTVRQCRAAGVACFVKQMGAKPIISAARQHHYDFGEAIGKVARFSAVDPMQESTGMWKVHFKDRKGGDWSEWPEDLRVRQFPEVNLNV